MKLLINKIINNYSKKTSVRDKYYTNTVYSCFCFLFNLFVIDVIKTL